MRKLYLIFFSLNSFILNAQVLTSNNTIFNMPMNIVKDSQKAVLSVNTQLNNFLLLDAQEIGLAGRYRIKYKSKYFSTEVGTSLQGYFNRSSYNNNNLDRAEDGYRIGLAINQQIFIGKTNISVGWLIKRYILNKDQRTNYSWHNALFTQFKYKQFKVQLTYLSKDLVYDRTFYGNSFDFTYYSSEQLINRLNLGISYNIDIAKNISIEPTIGFYKGEQWEALQRIEFNRPVYFYSEFSFTIKKLKIIPAFALVRYEPLIRSNCLVNTPTTTICPYQRAINRYGLSLEYKHSKKLDLYSKYHTLYYRQPSWKSKFRQFEIGLSYSIY